MDSLSPYPPSTKHSPRPTPSSLDHTPHHSPESIPSGLDHIPDANATSAQGKKPVWNVPPNGSNEVGAVMGASWPALSKSASVSSPKGPVISTPPSPKASMNNPNPAPARQKSLTRGAGAGTASNGIQPNSGPAPPIFPIPSPKVASSSNNNGAVPSQQHGSSEHQRSYGGNRRVNNGGGGGGLYHNNYGNRRDQERGVYELNHRNFGSRGIHIQPPPPPPPLPPRGMGPYLRPSQPVTAQFVAPLPPGRPFLPHMGYTDLTPHMYYVMAPPHPPEALRGAHFIPHPPPSPLLMIDPQRIALLKQIDFYFSSENLCTDTFLRQNMDAQGWVSVVLIAGFKRVREVTSNIPHEGIIQYILDTMRSSLIVEVQGEKLRRRNDWMRWPPLAPSDQFSNSAPQSPATPNTEWMPLPTWNQYNYSAPQSPSTPNADTLAASFHTIGLDGASHQNKPE